MFEKFLQSPECMTVLSWVLSHSEDDYSAAIIGIECNIMDMSKFMAVLSILEGAGFILTHEMSNEVMIRLNKDASIVQLLNHLKDEFNDNAFRSDYVSPSLAYLYSDELKKVVDSQVFEEIDVDGLIDMCKNYKDLDITDEKNMDLYNLCKKLEENGEYEEFIEKLENSFQK